MTTKRHELTELLSNRTYSDFDRIIRNYLESKAQLLDGYLILKARGAKDALRLVLGLSPVDEPEEVKKFDKDIKDKCFYPSTIVPCKHPGSCAEWEERPCKCGTPYECEKHPFKMTPPKESEGGEQRVLPDDWGYCAMCRYSITGSSGYHGKQIEDRAYCYKCYPLAVEVWLAEKKVEDAKRPEKPKKLSLAQKLYEGYYPEISSGDWNTLPENCQSEWFKLADISAAHFGESSSKEEGK